MADYLRKEKLQIEVKNKVRQEEHFHQDIELLYVLEGEMDVTVGEQDVHLLPEDIYVINANKKHKYNCSEDILFAQLRIEYQLVSDIFGGMDVLFWCDSTKDRRTGYEELRNTMRRLLNHYLSTRGGVANFGHIALCYQVMDLLSVNFILRETDRRETRERDKYEERLASINNYIRGNYSQPISLGDLAARIHLSEAYLSRFFKKNYGMGFAEYLTNIRLYHAVDALMYTDAAITRIAYDHGFTSVAMFNKAFKKAYGTTPSSMRQEMTKVTAGDPDQTQEMEVEHRLEKYLRAENTHDDTAAAAKRIEISIGNQDGEPITPCWNTLINGGSAEDLLRPEVREHLVLLSRELKFTYVRFWNIFSRQMLVQIDPDGGEYNFTRLDSILDFLLENNLFPQMELGQKPRRIQKGLNNPLIIEENAEFFKDMQQWLSAAEALLSHLFSKYPAEWLHRWRIELWYDESYEKRWETEDYFSLFRETYKLVRKYSASMEVGGCGLWAEGKGTEKKEFYKEWSKNGGTPDFLSVISFGYVREELEHESFFKRDTDMNALKYQLSQIKEDLKGTGFEDLKLIISEWNLTISDRNCMNDTCFKGAYILNSLMKNYDGADCIGYFLGSDCVTEHFDSHGLLYGGTGLVSKDGILKPAGCAFAFMNRLYPFCIGRGENYLVSASRMNEYGILCHNLKALNYHYYFTDEDRLKKEDVWKCFENTDELRIEMALTDIEDGIYQLRYYRINEQYGSILNLWRETGYEKHLSKSDIHYLKAMSRPGLVMQKLAVKDHTAQFCLTLAANEMLYLQMRKQV